MNSLQELFDVKLPEGPHPLIGKPAPAFTLTSLDDGEIILKSHLGKRVVVLDFWTTWAGPFHMAAPIFENLRKDYEKRDVVILAINVRQEQELVREFLKKSKRKLGIVVLDSDGHVARDYEISGFPQSFVINQDGKVSAVFRGFSSDLETQFQSELEKTLNTSTQE